MQMGRIGIGVAVVVAATLWGAPGAGACGGLVGENGTIQLSRTSTLVAFADGVERYVTSFEFTGEGEAVGSIVPLPGVPTKVERGGDWTLQRLAREVAPVTAAATAAGGGATLVAEEARVLQTARIDALDITILEGGGDAVGRWATEHGFLLTPDAPEVLDYYARRSPIFMAAKFDASRAARLGQTAGQGTPIMLTIPTDAPWVPLRILGLGRDGADVIDADVFVLTPGEPGLLAGGDGLSLERSEPASPQLLGDLRSDDGMSWVPTSMWLSYLRVATPAAALDYDLAISTARSVLPSPERAGLASGGDAVVLRARGSGPPRTWPYAAGLVSAAAVVALVGHRSRRPRPAA